MSDAYARAMPSLVGAIGLAVLALLGFGLLRMINKEHVLLEIQTSFFWKISFVHFGALGIFYLSPFLPAEKPWLPTYEEKRIHDIENVLDYALFLPSFLALMVYCAVRVVNESDRVKRLKTVLSVFIPGDVILYLLEKTIIMFVF